MRAERTGRARDRQVAAARGAEVAHLAGVRIPAIAERVRSGQRLEGVPGPLAPPADTGEDFARAMAAVVAALGSDEAVRRERALRDSVQAAFESVARTMHAMATVQQQVLDHVERSIDDPRLMAELMKADHAAAQMTRKAQTLLVMCGIWPARRETRPVSLYDCVRGAQSRIVEFGRIEVHGGQTLYAVPPAVEGLMHAIAELLENATVFSPSRTQVQVTVREVGAGAVIEIDDAGLGMPPDVLAQASAQLRDDLDLAQLGAVPRLGLACVGRWSRELGFNVELTGASAYGGTRAVTFIPYRLLTEPLSQTTGQHRVPQPTARQPHTPAPGVPLTEPPPPASAPAPEPGGPARHGHRPVAGTPEEAWTGETAPYGPEPNRRHGPAGSGPAGRAGTAVYGHGQGSAPQPGGTGTAAHASGPYEPQGGQPGGTPMHRPPTHAHPHGEHPASAETAGPGGAEEAPARAHGAATASGLPRRRSRRGGPSPSPQQSPRAAQTPSAVIPPAPPSSWTPEAARASIASVVSGSRRGRAAVGEESETRNEHDGGRS
nr:ATP-binding protein [Streptomyces sp. PR69]